MSLTYSVNIGTEFEATRKSDILSVLKELPDNTEKLISPKDVRDAFLSAWANPPFKQTTEKETGKEYIGIDSGNPSSRDIKRKILLGKRSYGNIDILDDNLLSKLDTDIYFYNTKQDSEDQSSTRISILAGTNSEQYKYSPYIEAKSSNNSISLEIRNTSNNGPINIYSQTGKVFINGISFPSVSDNTSNATDGKILRYYGSYPNGYLKWDYPTIKLSEFGDPTGETNVWGNPVKLNGHSLEFIEDYSVPKTIGGVDAGSSFPAGSFNGQNWPLSEVIRKILYPFVKPEITITAVNSQTGMNYGEIGKTASVNINWSITIYPRDNSEYIQDYYITIKKPDGTFINTPDASPYSGLSFSSNTPGTKFSGTLSHDLYSNSVGTYSFIYMASDVNDSSQIDLNIPSVNGEYRSGFSYSVHSDFSFVYPVFYGFTNSVINDNVINFSNGASTISKIIQSYPGGSQSLKFNSKGDGYFYFAYPNQYFNSPVSEIRDANGFVLYDGNINISSFTYSNLLITNYDTPTNYTIWRTIGTCSYTQNGLFEFKF